MKTKVPENGDDTERFVHLVCPECNALNTITVPAKTKPEDVPPVTCNCGASMHPFSGQNPKPPPADKTREDHK